MIKMIGGLCLMAAITLTYGCKKEKIKPTPEKEESQEYFPEWVNYNKANSNLPDNQINALSIDQSNVKWIGTANGLAQLKGSEWTIYNSANSPLPSSFIQAVAAGDNGTVWVGTNNGLAKFDGNTWAVYNTQNSMLTDNRIKCITYDSKHRTAWIGTEQGIVKINNNTWEYIETFNTLLSITTDHNGDLWTGEFNDFAFIGMIKKYQNGKWTTHRLDLMGYTSALPYAIGVDSKNRVVAALAGTVVKSVIRYDGNNWMEVDRPDNARGLKAIAIEGEKVWVGGATFSLLGNKSSPLIVIPGVDTPVLSMALDANGRKWLGTYSSGIAIYNSTNK